MDLLHIFDGKNDDYLLIESDGLVSVEQDFPSGITIKSRTEATDFTLSRSPLSSGRVIILIQPCTSGFKSTECPFDNPYTQFASFAF